MLILPANLLFQWHETLENAIPFPYHIWQDGQALPEADGLIITTYHNALKNHETISQNIWDLVIFEEANILSKPENKITSTLKAACQGAFKLLLTPTPITMSIMDIYGLIHFIDETVLPDEDYFYKRYFRKPENYPELSQWVSQFAFRTLKKQVTNYVNFTKRFAFTLAYNLSQEEQAIYDKLAAYLALPQRQAYPKMDLYDLTLLLYHILSSSPQALCQTIAKALLRIDNPQEQAHLLELQALIKSCQTYSKLESLKQLLKKQFSEAKDLGDAQKALVFVDNATTLALLKQHLSENYQVITSQEQDYAQKFRSIESGILIASGDAAKGLNLQFCSLVINYDLLYNAVDLEQRISRCHRQGQMRDVLVVNFMCKENVADVRTLELINKRTLQFDSIFGRSDDILGRFVDSVEEIAPPLRSCEEIKQDFATNLSAHKGTNEKIIAEAEAQLFTSFTKKVADNVTITPQYIKDKGEEINRLLWPVVKAWFKNEPDYVIDEASQTIERQSEHERVLFYYESGGRHRRYKGKGRYGMAKDFKPASGRLNLLSPVVKGILANIACALHGKLQIDADITLCEVGLYCVETPQGAQYMLIGRDEAGNIMQQAACEAILNAPVLTWQQMGEPVPMFLKNITAADDRHVLDELVPNGEIFDKLRRQNNSAQAEEVENIRLYYAKERAKLEREIVALSRQVKQDKNMRDKHFSNNILALRKEKDLKQS